MESIYLLIVISFLIFWWLKPKFQKKRIFTNAEQVSLPVISSLDMDSKIKENKLSNSITKGSLLVSMIINHGEVIEKIYERPTGERFRIKTNQKS